MSGFQALALALTLALTLTLALALALRSCSPLLPPPLPVANPQDHDRFARHG